MQEEKKSHVVLQNPFLDGQDVYTFYHLGLSTDTHNIKEMFSDVKVVCLGGSSRRMKSLVETLAAELNLRLPAGQDLVNICASTDRFVMYKVGPILAVNHGIGIPSLSVVLHELAKLLHRAGCSLPGLALFRVGTSGGLGLQPGTVCVSTGCCDTRFRPYLEQYIMGQRVERPALLDAELTEQLRLAAESLGDCELRLATGQTLCTNDFYEEQGRMDGAICEFSAAQRLSFLRDAHARGVRNLEMESLAFAALTHKLGLKAACITVVIVNRFEHDRVTHTPEQLASWELRMTRILAAYIRARVCALPTTNESDARQGQKVK